MSPAYDAVVVGARCAGAATALLLARAGARVALLDRARFPSDTVSGHFILHPGTRRLAQWGVLDRVVASGAPPVTRCVSDFGDFELAATVPTGDAVPAGIGPRRSILDAILVQCAAEAGAELYEHATVESLLWDGERVRGVRARAAGAAREFAAAVVVGADGKHSTVARLADAPAYRESPSLTCWYYSYWEGLGGAALEAYRRPGAMIFIFPTNDQRSLVAIAWPRAQFARVRADVEGALRATVHLVPQLRERFAAAHRADRFYGMADLPNFFRQACGPGWVLVGDAGHHTDPMGALGMSNAFVDAELAAAAIVGALGGRQSLGDALAGFWRARDAHAVPDHELNLLEARLESIAPEVLALRAAVRHDPEEAGRLYAARMSVRPLHEYLAPEHLRGVFGRAKAALTA